MIKIKKFENVFGIKELKGADKLDRLNVIYAPNGTAKSSISDALCELPKNGDITDVYGYNLTPKYQIDVDGTLYDEISTPSYKIIRYSGLDALDFEDLDSFKPLVISPSLKKAVAASMHKIEKAIIEIEDAVLAAFPKKEEAKVEKNSLNR